MSSHSVLVQATAALLAAFAGAAATTAAGLDGALARESLAGVGIYGAFADFVGAVVASGIIAGLVALWQRANKQQPAEASAAEVPSSDDEPQQSGPLWQYCGGVCGAIYVSCAVLGSPLGGFSVLFAAAVAGQLVVGAILDCFFAVGGAQSRIDTWKIGALAVTVLGAILSAVGALLSDDGTITAANAAIGAVLGLVAGTAVALQTVANTRLAERLNSSATVTFFSISLGFVITLIVCIIVTFATEGGAAATVEQIDASRSSPALWLGGIGSVCAVSAGATLPPFVGVAGFSVALVAGQLATSLGLDAGGVLGGSGSVDAWRIVGAVIVFVGAACAQTSNPFAGNAAASGVQSDPKRDGGIPGHDVIDFAPASDSSDIVLASASSPSSGKNQGPVAAEP
ncbi:hypothetical protein FNF31_07005 [Cafeteria roenbergensis]|uniref:EamA domain-containing protein n=1 Tax=Cafeteria roenbergensis TaxID=33653 RepID=A0A5A8DCH0_CAFRO|nr:hypothetical protein FNF31_07005 [Cafeteria roenbergensis]KAA0161890.1 hypothetical protein FNF28_04887 [Cafeteria roenbergensis]